MYCTLSFIIGLFSLPDSTSLAGEYSQGGTVARLVTIYPNKKYQAKSYGCLGWFGEHEGSWYTIADTIYLERLDTIRGKFLVQKNELIEINFSDRVLQGPIFGGKIVSKHEWLNFREPYRCYKKFYTDGTLKEEYKYLVDQYSITGFYKTGEKEYLQNYTLSGKPIGVWYRYNSNGDIIDRIAFDENLKSRK